MIKVTICVNVVLEIFWFERVVLTVRVAAGARIKHRIGMSTHRNKFRC